MKSREVALIRILLVVACTGLDPATAVAQSGRPIDNELAAVAILGNARAAAVAAASYTSAGPQGSVDEFRRQMAPLMVRAELKTRYLFKEAIQLLGELHPPMAKIGPSDPSQQLLAKLALGVPNTELFEYVRGSAAVSILDDRQREDVYRQLERRKVEPDSGEPAGRRWQALADRLSREPEFTDLPGELKRAAAGGSVAAANRMVDIAIKRAIAHKEILSLLEMVK